MSIEVDDFGGAPFADHNQLCHVCWEHKAVLLLNNGVFQPCHRCQDRGWILVKLPGWLRRRLAERAWRER